ncbi:MAG: hypothetical protein PHG08_05510 [Bacilli bacterium]|jgi:spore maturation protein A|nr:hypothetical protein [Bacilli bacterium]HHU24599.1 hypothetical protein [Acholeplasmataceae bacterium]
MINRIWLVLLFLGILISVSTGNLNTLGNVMLSSAKESIDIYLKIATMLIFWSGIIRIAIDSGLVKRVSLILIKPLGLLFPELPRDCKALELIAGNVVCNLLGLGTASTPLGLKAMEELQKTNLVPDTSTRSMTTFVLLNASSLTIFPSSLFGLRALFGANDSFKLILLMSITSAFATIIAITCDRLFYFFSQRNIK